MTQYRDVEARPAGTVIETRTGPYTGLWLVTDDSGYPPGCSRSRVSTAVRIPGPVREACPAGWGDSGLKKESK